MTTTLRTRRSTLRIRTAVPADHAAVRAVLQRAYAQYEAVLPPAVFRAYLADLADLADLANPVSRAGDAELLVAELEEGIVGSVTFFPDAAAEGLGWPEGWAGVRALAVEPDQRGLGIARRLMDACAARAMATGSSTICLHTAEFMSAAVRLYRGLGYERRPEFDVDVTPKLGVEAPTVIATAYVQPLPSRAA